MASTFSACRRLGVSGVACAQGVLGLVPGLWPGLSSQSTEYWAVLEDAFRVWGLVPGLVNCKA